MEMTHHGQGVFPDIESEISHRESQLRNLSAEQGRRREGRRRQSHPPPRPTLATSPGMASVPTHPRLSNDLGGNVFASQRHGEIQIGNEDQETCTHPESGENGRGGGGRRAIAASPV